MHSAASVACIVAKRPAPGRAAATRRMAFAGCTLLSAALVAWTWGTWTDPLVDFGRELYVPWRLTEGAVLYRDVAYFNGPLSPWINACWFRLAGASLSTLVAANLVVTGLVAYFLWRAMRGIASRGASYAAVTAFLLLFAFAQYTRTRNYNFASPYSHEMTHGLLLVLLAGLAGRRAARDRKGAAWAGLWAGAALLTKPEIALAAGVAAVAGTTASLAAASASPRKFLERGGALAVAASAAPLAALGILSLSLPLSEAAWQLASPWRMAANGEIRGLDFYRFSLGTLNLGASLQDLLVSVARWGVLVIAAATAACWGAGRGDKTLRDPGGRGSRRAATPPSGRDSFADGGRSRLSESFALPEVAPPLGGLTLRVAAVAVASGLASIWLYASGFAWPLMERALPVGMALLALWQAVASQQAPARSQRRRRAALRSAWCLTALAMMAKLGFSARICQYGFVLAVPATAAVVAALVDWLPREMARRGRSAAAFRAAVVPPLIAYAAAYHSQQAMLLDRSVPLGAGGDAIAGPAFAAPVAEACRQIERHVAANDTLLALPEGTLLNYLTRRRASTSHLSWMPPELLFFGEAAMLAELAAAPPDWIVLAPRGLAEYGRGEFGAGYADAVAGWVEAHYDAIASWGEGAVIGDCEDAQQPPPWRLLKRRLIPHSAAAIPTSR